MDFRVPRKAACLKFRQLIAKFPRNTSLPFRTTNFIFKRSFMSARAHTDRPLSLRRHYPSDVRRHVRQMTRVITGTAAVPEGSSLVVPHVCNPQHCTCLLCNTSCDWQSRFIGWRSRVQIASRRPLITNHVHCFPQCLHINVYIHPITPRLLPSVSFPFICRPLTL
jgi:hypothetical protein